MYTSPIATHMDVVGHEMSLNDQCIARNDHKLIVHLTPFHFATSGWSPELRLPMPMATQRFSLAHETLNHGDTVTPFGIGKSTTVHSAPFQRIIIGSSPYPKAKHVVSVGHETSVRK